MKSEEDKYMRMSTWRGVLHRGIVPLLDTSQIITLSEVCAHRNPPFIKGQAVLHAKDKIYRTCPIAYLGWLQIKGKKIDSVLESYDNMARTVDNTLGKGSFRHFTDWWDIHGSSIALAFELRKALKKRLEDERTCSPQTEDRGSTEGG